MGAAPEQVSFRLSANVIDAFGVVGVEGVFRKSAECALDVLRQNKETLLQSLRSFIYDPLIIEGQKNAVGTQKHNEAKDKMQKQLDDIMRRLSGHVPSMQFNHEDPKAHPFIELGACALSTKGCVEKLITINANKQCLSKMFFGWMPFM